MNTTPALAIPLFLVMLVMTSCGKRWSADDDLTIRALAIELADRVERADTGAEITLALQQHLWSTNARWGDPKVSWEIRQFRDCGDRLPDQWGALHRSIQKRLAFVEERIEAGPVEPFALEVMRGEVTRLIEAAL